MKWDVVLPTRKWILRLRNVWDGSNLVPPCKGNISFYSGMEYVEDSFNGTVALKVYDKINNHIDSLAFSHGLE